MDDIYYFPPGGGAAQNLTLNAAYCDLSGRLSVSMLFLLMQELAGADSTRLGFGKTFVDQEGIFWALSRVKAESTRIPRIGESITLRTWHGDPMRYVFPRHFLVTDASGEELMHVSTAWMLVDLSTRQLVMPSARGYGMPPQPEGLPQYKLPGRVPAMEQAQADVRTPKYSDFDVNGHMNNARYPVWMLDLFPPSHFLGHFLREIHINYINEIREGEQVALWLGQDGDAFSVRGLVGEEIKFEAAGRFARMD